MRCVSWRRAVAKGSTSLTAPQGTGRTGTHPTSQSIPHLQLMPSAVSQPHWWGDCDSTEGKRDGLTAVCQRAGCNTEKCSLPY